MLINGLVASVTFYGISSSSLLVLNKVAISAIPNATLLLAVQLLSTVFFIACPAVAGLINVRIVPDLGTLKAYCSVAAVFLLTIYSNFQVIHYIGVNSFIILRCGTPLVLSILDWQFMGRDFPRGSSLASLLGVLLGGSMYSLIKLIETDPSLPETDPSLPATGSASDFYVFDPGLLWSIAWLISFLFDMLYIKHVVHAYPCSGLERTLYQNALALPMLLLWVPFEKSGSLRIFLAADIRATTAIFLSCISGTILSYTGMTLRSKLTATSFSILGIVCKILSAFLNEVFVSKEKSKTSLVCLLAVICSSACYKQAPLRRANVNKTSLSAQSVVIFSGLTIIPLVILSFGVQETAKLADGNTQVAINQPSELCASVLQDSRHVNPVINSAYYTGTWSDTLKCCDLDFVKKSDRESCLVVNSERASGIGIPLRYTRNPAQACCPKGCGDPFAFNFDPGASSLSSTATCVCSQRYSHLEGGHLLGGFKPIEVAPGMWRCPPGYRENGGQKLSRGSPFPWTLDSDTYLTRRSLTLTWCGSLCSNIYFPVLQSGVINVSLPTPFEKQLKVSKGLFFPQVRRKIDCNTIFSHSSEFDLSEKRDKWPPPFQIPSVFWDDFTYGDKISVTSAYFVSNRQTSAALDVPGSEKNLGVEQSFSLENIHQLIEEAPIGNLGTYGREVSKKMYEFLRRHQHLFIAKHAMVVGSTSPWIEAILIHLGAAHVTTVDYGSFPALHPKMSVVTHEQLTTDFLSKSKTSSFDFAITYSSLEHAGLGRYGDIMNPWADRLACAKVWCQLKSGAHFVFGVPTSSPPGTDVNSWESTIQYNDQRLYGRTFYANALNNFEQVDREGSMIQEPFLLRRVEFEDP